MVIVFLSPEMRVSGWFPFTVKDSGYILQQICCFYWWLLAKDRTKFCGDLESK